MAGSNGPCLCGDPECRRCFPAPVDPLADVSLGAVRGEHAGHIRIKAQSGTFQIKIGRTHGGRRGPQPGIKAMRDRILDAINQHVNLGDL